MPVITSPTVGLLALQGASELHGRLFARLGVATLEVRTRAELDRVDGLVIPGGESTTISKLLDANDLFDPIQQRLGSGMPVLGTCAGMILLADEVLDGRPDQHSFGRIDLAVRRNGFGRQIDSFEADLDVVGFARRAARRVHPGTRGRARRARCRGVGPNRRPGGVLSAGVGAGHLVPPRALG